MAVCGDIQAAVTHIPDFLGTEGGDVQSKAVPTYGHYNFSVTDYQSLGCEKIKNISNQVKEKTGVPLRVVNQMEDLIEGSSSMQIINNVRVEDIEQLGNPATPPQPGTSLFTIYLPPGWTRQENVPIILRGLGYTRSNNGAFGDPFWTDLVAQSRGDGKRGIILATSNTGGMEGLGVHDEALHDVGRFLTAMKNLGGNPNEVVFTGGSRGGIVSFVWAANRFNYPYRAIAVFAEVPTSRVGDIITAPLQTNPAVLTLLKTIWGEEGVKGSEDPSVKSDTLNILTGHTDAQGADMDRLPVGYLTNPSYRDKWKALRVVVIGGGSHDEWIPFSFTLELDRLLENLQVPHTTFLALGTGHEGTSAFTQREASKFMESLLRPGAPPYQPFREGRVYLIQRDLVNHHPETQELLNTADLPFTASFPYRLQTNQSGLLITCGQEGKGWKGTFGPAIGAPLFTAEGVFDGTECAMSKFSAPAAIGDYFWEFEFDGRIQNSTNTPCIDRTTGNPLPAMTNIVNHKPDIEESFAPGCRIGFGIDQYHWENGILPP